MTTYRDERGRFRKIRYEEMDPLQKFSHDHLAPAARRLAEQLAEQWAADADFLAGDVWIGGGNRTSSCAN